MKNTYACSILPGIMTEIFVEQKQQALQGYYGEILQILGKPPQDGIPYPIPDCTLPNRVDALLSIHSPSFLLIDHKKLGLLPVGFHKYNTPLVIGQGKVIVQARRVIGDSWVIEPVIVVEGVYANSTRGTIASFSLQKDGYQHSSIRYSVWVGQRLAIVSQDSPLYRFDETPAGLWERVAEAVKTNPLLPDERLLKIHPPTTRPLSIRGINLYRD